MNPVEALLEKTIWSRARHGNVFIKAADFISKLIIKINNDDCQGLAAQMAYAILLALIPASICLFSMYGAIGQQTDLFRATLEMIERLAPPHAVDLIKQAAGGVVQGSSRSLTIVGFAAALWSASRGAAVLIKGMDRASQMPPGRLPFWYVPVVSITIVFSLGVMLLIASNLLVFGHHVIHYLVNHAVSPWNNSMFLNALRWLFVLSGIAFFSTFVYALLMRPRIKRMDWKMAFPGAIVFIVMWVGISLIFGVYVEKMNRFNPIYGSLGAVVLLMTWLYLSSLSVLIGAEVIVSLNPPQLPVLPPDETSIQDAL